MSQLRPGFAGPSSNRPPADSANADNDLGFKTEDLQDKLRDVGLLDPAQCPATPVYFAATLEADSDIEFREDKDKGKGKGKEKSAQKDSGTGKAIQEDSPGQKIKAEPDLKSDKQMDAFRADLQARYTKQMSAEEERVKTQPKEEGPDVPSKLLVLTGIEPDDRTILHSIEEDIRDAEEFVAEGFKRRRLHQSSRSQGRERNGGRRRGRGRIRPKRSNFNFFGSLSNAPELFMELAKHLRIKDLISLYAISKDFHETINGHLSHIMKTCAAYNAPGASRIFVFNLYAELCVPDPVGRPHPRNPAIVRLVPSLRWLQMVLHRERCVRDILACLAREGHRTPKTMPVTLKKMWLTMDIATSARRVQFMHNQRYWTHNDLYNVQLFLLKLDMRLNDPLVGPADDGLRKLMLGQRGLTPLCKLLKRTAFTDPMEVVEATIRYAYHPKPEHQGLPMFGVPANEIGKGHLEGWGLGRVHLYRIDELLMREAVRRNMGLQKHMMSMMIWGFVDPITKKDIEPTEEEMYMSEEDEEVDWFKRKPRPKPAAARKKQDVEADESMGLGDGDGGHDDNRDDEGHDETDNEGDDEREEEDCDEDGMVR